jgi:hypothetical protein
MPKSSTLGVNPSPLATRKMFSGLRSRCTTPASWAQATASMTGSRISRRRRPRQRRSGSAPRETRRASPAEELLHGEEAPALPSRPTSSAVDHVGVHAPVLAHAVGDLRLADEALQRVLAVLALVVEDLHRHLAAGPDVRRAVHRARRARPEKALQTVLPVDVDPTRWARSHPLRLRAHRVRQGPHRRRANPRRREVGRSSATYRGWSVRAAHSRAECMESIGSPRSTTGMPRRDAVMGPMVDPQPMSVRVTKSCSGTSAAAAPAPAAAPPSPRWCRSAGCGCS